MRLPDVRTGRQSNRSAFVVASAVQGRHGARRVVRALAIAYAGVVFAARWARVVAPKPLGDLVSGRERMTRRTRNPPTAHRRIDASSDGNGNCTAHQCTPARTAFH